MLVSELLLRVVFIARAHETTERESDLRQTVYFDQSHKYVFIKDGRRLVNNYAGRSNESLFNHGTISADAARRPCLNRPER